MDETSPPWLTKLNDHLYFGPRPKTPEDLAHLRGRLGISHIVNASPHAITARKNYTQDYGERYPFTTIDAPLAVGALTSKGAPLLLAAVRAIHVQLGGNGEDACCCCYVHAETGLMDEAYIAIILWRLRVPQEVPSNVEQWLHEQHKEALFDDDADKRALLVAVWKLLDVEADRVRKMSMFGTVKKRVKVE